jgi:hypothetical protein
VSRQLLECLEGVDVAPKASGWSLWNHPGQCLGAFATACEP